MKDQDKIQIIESAWKGDSCLTDEEKKSQPIAYALEKSAREDIMFLVRQLEDLSIRTEALQNLVKAVERAAENMGLHLDLSEAKEALKNV